MDDPSVQMDRFEPDGWRSVASGPAGPLRSSTRLRNPDCSERGRGAGTGAAAGASNRVLRLLDCMFVALVFGIKRVGAGTQRAQSRTGSAVTRPRRGSVLERAGNGTHRREAAVRHRDRSDEHDTLHSAGCRLLPACLRLRECTAFSIAEQGISGTALSTGRQYRLSTVSEPDTVAPGRAIGFGRERAT